MKIAITGGAGFIGRRLTAALVAAGHRVRVLTRQPARPSGIEGLEFFQGDLTGRVDLAKFLDGIELLFHCAGEVKDEARMYALHVSSTQKLIEAASGRIARWVQLSSAGAYGPVRSGQVCESTKLLPVGAYEETKAASDLMVCQAGLQGAFAYSILRPSIVYGAGMPNQSLYTMLKMVERRLFFFVGRPGASANYIHVDNVVEALLRCGFGNSAAGHIFNLSDHCTIQAFVQMMAEQLGVPAPTLRLPETPTRWLARAMQSVPGWPLTLSRVNALTSQVNYPTSKIESLLSYRHKTSMAEGIADLVRDYRQRTS